MLLFEDELIAFVKNNVGVERMSIMDLGCGFNAVVRRFVKSGGIKHACDIDWSSVMTTRSDNLDAEFMNKENIRDCKLETRTESFIRTSVESESMDCVMSMNALLHVGQRVHQKTQEGGSPFVILCSAQAWIPLWWSLYTSASACLHWGLWRTTTKKGRNWDSSIRDLLTTAQT